MLEGAAAENAELNRRLQEIESRRQLELAEDEGRSQIDDLLRVTQERLAGQTEKLIAAEDRVRDLEGDLADARDRAEIAEGDLRTHQMSEALREIREPEGAETVSTEIVEDRRSSTPFLKELSYDAKKSLSRLTGIVSLLKHKPDARDQAPLIKELTATLRRLDHSVADMADADALVRGTIELQVRKTDLEALLQRTVEESGLGTDRELRVKTEAIVMRMDGQRVEQIIGGLLRNAGDRAAAGKEVTVKLQAMDGGALISVEDPETSSDASMSPVVRRLAEILGGWAKVESTERGGSSFRVFIPEAGTAAPAPAVEPAEMADPELQIVVDDAPAPVPAAQEQWEPSGEQILAQELRRLATEMPKEPERSSRRSRAKR